MDFLLKVASFVAAYWLAGILIAVLAVLYFWWIQHKRPTDTAGNGITVGQAKAFDNRSLTLRVERLNASLESLRVVDQSFAENVSTVQERTSDENTRSMVLGVKGISTGKSEKGTEEGATKKAASAASESDKLKIGLAASDILNDQLNLASQIFNLQLLYERSLTDRMIGKDSRLQTVLGFPVSITPPGGFENCAAVVEITVMAEGSMTVSLVALMPQQKTYNAESLSANERSIEGSSDATGLKIGFKGRHRARQLFIRPEPDTIAFERRPAQDSTTKNSTIFGWEFRPVLGRRAVSAGTRQMLAVIAVPVADKKDSEKAILEIVARSYWRRYDRRRQTSVPNWSWLPWRVDRSESFNTTTQTLEIPSTATVHSALAPRIDDIKWVSLGQRKAIVIVKGCNFFSGTKVLIGASEYREENGTLTLKSDQALEFETTVDLLATGNAVLSGRFGPTCQLVCLKVRMSVTLCTSHSQTSNRCESRRHLRSALMS